MPTIRQDDLIQSIADAFQFISYYHPRDFIQAMGRAYELEQGPAAKDAIAQILAWKDVDHIWELAHFVAVSRPGHVLEIPDVPSGSVSSMEVPALAISSTDCRARVGTGQPVWYLVPDGVVQYIAKHNLYRGAA